MAEARRKTTVEERKEIVEYCINHERNFKKILRHCMMYLTARQFLG